MAEWLWISICNHYSGPSVPHITWLTAAFTPVTYVFASYLLSCFSECFSADLLCSGGY